MNTLWLYRTLCNLKCPFVQNLENEIVNVEEIADKYGSELAAPGELRDNIIRTNELDIFSDPDVNGDNFYEQVSSICKQIGIPHDGPRQIQGITGKENSIKFLATLLNLTHLSRSTNDVDQPANAMELAKEFDRSVILITHIAENRDRIFDPKVRMFPSTFPRKYDQDVKNIPRELENAIKK